MDKINDYEMTLRLSKKKHATCTICNCQAQEMYIMRRHGQSDYLCRTCTSNALLIAALMR